MEDRKLNERESLELITRMIKENARKCSSACRLSASDMGIYDSCYYNCYLVCFLTNRLLQGPLYLVRPACHSRTAHLAFQPEKRKERRKELHGPDHKPDMARIRVSRLVLILLRIF